jgi:enoyl-CoA hydratase/carnithine racemase
VSDLKVTRYEVAQGVATITLDRPDRLNAWTSRMEHEYRRLMLTAEADPEVRVIVVTGAGRGFCAGADTEALDGLSRGEPYVSAQGELPPVEVTPAFDHTLSFPLGLSKPVIAAVNGAAAGVGFVLMCFADIRFAARGAKLTTSFARLGLPAEHGVAWVLPRIVGAAHAADLLLSSRVVLAEEAAAMGLVNRVIEPDDLLAESLDYARSMAAELSPRSLATIKRQLWASFGVSLSDEASRAGHLLVEMLAGEDFREGTSALLGRRPPRFAPPAKQA